MIKVKLLGPFKCYMKNKPNEDFWMVNAENMTIEAFINTTEIIHSPMNYSILVNNRRQEKNYILQANDELLILPLFYAG